MKKLLKKLVPQSVIDNRMLARHQKAYDEWLANGKPGNPPHRAKQLVIEEYGTKWKLDTLVETGTFMGEMIIAQRDNFKRIISIELSNELHQRAVELFKSAPQIELLQGDSGEVLQALCPKLDKPSLFWLDGHWSEGVTAKGALNTPIVNELKAVLGTGLNHVALVDDARCFNGTDDYPTIDEVRKLVAELRPEYTFEVEDDVIRLTPPAQG